LVKLPRVVKKKETPAAPFPHIKTISSQSLISLTKKRSGQVAIGTYGIRSVTRRDHVPHKMTFGTLSLALRRSALRIRFSLFEKKKFHSERMYFLEKPAWVEEFRWERQISWFLADIPFGTNA
jgi:hypothetical protein